MKYRISTHKQAQPNMCSPLVHSYITINLSDDRSHGGATVRPPSSSFTSLSEGGESECEGVAVGASLRWWHRGLCGRWRATAGAPPGGGLLQAVAAVGLCQG
jgi:hypothetical protein